MKYSQFRDFMSDFREIVKFRPTFKVRKNFKLLKSIHVLYHFEVRDLENHNMYIVVWRNIYILQKYEQ